MTYLQHTVTAICLVSVLSVVGRAEDPKQEDRSRIWQRYSEQKYGDLNKELKGELTPVFQALGDLGTLHEYFDAERNPEKHAALSRLVVQAMADAGKGDVVEAMFAHAICAITPPEYLFPIIVKEAGPEGQLSQVFSGRPNDLVKYLQYQQQQGYFGPPNFRLFIAYLAGARTSLPNRTRPCW